MQTTSTVQRGYAGQHLHHVQICLADRNYQSEDTQASCEALKI